LNSRKQVISLIVASAVLLVLLIVGAAFTFNTYMSVPNVEKRQVAAQSDAKRVAATIAIFPSKLPDHLQYATGMELNDTRGITINHGIDEYPIIDIKVRPKHDGEDFVLEISALKTTGTETSSNTLFQANEILSSVKKQLLPSNTNGWGPSAVIAVANTANGAKQIASMIKKNDGQSSYSVIFPGDEQEYVIDDDDIKRYGAAEHPLWRKILGCAILEKFPSGEGVYGTQDAPKPAIQTILETLTGAKIKTIRLDSMSEADLAQTLKGEMQRHDPVLFSTKGSGELTEFSTIFKQSNAYPVLYFDAEKNMIAVPRNSLLKEARKLSENDRDENGNLARVSIKELRQFGRFISFPQG
jgi:hypothetical protein